MRRVLPYIAAAMAYLMAPGSAELTENLVHVVRTGHTAHAFFDAEHQPDDVEHGCAGPFHVCSCHQSVGFTLARTAAWSVPGLSSESVFSGLSQHARQGYFGRIYRPPIA